MLVQVFLHICLNVVILQTEKLELDMRVVMATERGTT